MKYSYRFITNFSIIAFSVILIVILASCSSDNTTTPVPDPIPTEEVSAPIGRSIHLELNTPKDADSSDDYIIIRSQYALSYNKNNNVSNWVSWELNKDWYGDEPRFDGNFITDTSLPASFYRVKHSDYTNSGYDRSHLTASEERTKTPEDNKATFLMSNIIPQRPDLNQGVWYDMEKWCMKMCIDSSKELFVCAGGIFKSGKKLKDTSAIPVPVIAVPDSCFKIVVILEPGQKLVDVNSNTRIEAVIMPNIQGIRTDDWQKYKRTVNDIEKATGYNFLNYVRNDIQTVIENK